MSDDAFARVCDLLNDVAMPVRALAAQVLGDFPSVSLELLEQTLDKKLMSHLKVHVYFRLLGYIRVAGLPFYVCVYTFLAILSIWVDLAGSKIAITSKLCWPAAARSMRIDNSVLCTCLQQHSIHATTPLFRE